MTPKQLLFAFYDLTFPLSLDISFPFNDINLQNNDSLKSLLDKNFPSWKKTQVLAKLTNYIRNVAPSVKIEPLLHFISSNIDYEPKCLLDFGCGSGNIARYISNHLNSIEKVWGVDSDESILPDNIASQTTLQFLWRTNLNLIEIIPRTCDLILAIDCLHHLDTHQQKDVVSKFQSLLEPNGILYIYEDSWTFKGDYPSNLLEMFDKSYMNFNEEQKIELLNLNEFWSNKWCYERVFDIDRTFYRSLEEWCSFLASTHFDIAFYGLLGFDNRRLHGVPSAWIIARNRK